MWLSGFKSLGACNVFFQKTGARPARLSMFWFTKQADAGAWVLFELNKAESHMLEVEQLLLVVYVATLIKTVFHYPHAPKRLYECGCCLFYKFIFQCPPRIVS